MKIKIKNVFEPEKEVEIKNLHDDKAVVFDGKPGEPNIIIRCKNNDGFPVFINMSKTACLAIAFKKDTDPD
jgi:hypothetical protein